MTEETWVVRFKNGILLFTEVESGLLVVDTFHSREEALAAALERGAPQSQIEDIYRVKGPGEQGDE